VLSVTVDATIQGLTLTQGYVKGTELDRNGGVILAQSALTISDVTVYSNTTNANGAVYVGGTVVVANSTFYSNSAIVGGGLYAAASAYITKSQFVLNNSNVGGGLYAAHTLEVSDTSFMTNSAVVGGGLYSLSSTQLSQVSFISNTAIVGGGMQSAGPTRLSNTTFRLNSATVGGGAQLLATSEIQDSNFLGNIGTARGGGLALMGASAITDTTFIENSAEIGGATDIYRRTDMLRVTFSGNRASISGVAVFADAVSVTNTQFISNQTLYGGIAVLTGNTSGDRTFSNVLFADSVATGINGAALSADTGQNILLMHVTIAASSPNTATAIYLDNAQMWLTNTLIANYDTGILRGSGSVTDTSTLFSDVNMPYSGTIASSNSHSITGTATFVDAVNGNFHLVSGSAGINMGTDAGLSEDYDGDLRPQGGGYDIGYDETDAVGTLSLTASETLHVGDLTTFTATVGNAIVYSYTWDLGDGTVNTTTAGSLYTDMSNNGHIYPSGRGYTVIVTATTNIGELTTSVFVHAGSLACFAETTGDNVTDYLSSDASALRDAIAAANEGGTVKLAGLCAGATTEDGTTQVSLITKTLTVQGGFSNTDWFTYDPSANPTTVDAAAQGRVIYATVDVTLQGFTVTQGATTFVGAGVLADNNLTLTDMTLYSNTTAQSGGGAWVTGRLFMNKSTVISNTAKYQGGGIASIEAATISDSELISNTADMSDGGGLFADGYITLTRILFTANSAGLKGGAVIGNSGGSIVSNTFTANQASVGGAMVLAGAADTTQVLTSTFERNSSTEIGGAIYLEAASEPYHSFITATRFVRNSSMSGGTLSIGNGVIATVDNGLFVHNSASEGPIDIEVSGSTVPASLNARHNTFVNTDGVAIEAGDAIDGDQAYITNSIFSGYDYPLQIGPQQADMVADGMLIYDVNDAQLGDRITITHIYKADPAFIDPSSDNYHITPASTALNTGVPTQVATDADGDMRPQGGGVDLGYDETEDRVLFSASNSGDTLLGNTTTFTATLHAGAGFDFALDFGDGVITTPVDSSFNPQQMILSHTYASVGTYAAVITASNSFTTLAASVPVKVGVLSCYAEVTGDNVTDFNSIDASAVRSAIAAADEGGTIKIAGTCAGVANENQTNQVVYISKTLALQGGYTHTNWTISDPIANPTILDAQQGGRVIYANAAVSLQGFTVTHGLALNGGGGIYATRPITLTSIGIIENTSVAIGGGGAYLNGSASLSNTVCMSNTATNGDAGGIYFNEMASVESSVFSGNSAATGWAGGANFQSSSLITNSVFSHNISIIGGGAVLVWENTTAKSRFIGNSAERGGAIAMAKSSAKKRLINVLFAENTATSKGAAIHIERGELIEIIHSTLANATMQTGASIYVEDGTTMISNTLISSHTIGIQKVHGTVTDSHTLFSNVTKPYSGTIAIDPNSITGTAVFIDSASGNYHLETGSAGINASDLSVLGVTEDTDGELRPQGVGYDIGYDETPYRATLIANNDGPQLLGNTVQLSATLGNGAGFTYTWNFGNGTNSAPSGLSVSHIYTSTGRYTATIVADNALGSLSASTVVEVIALPTATATATATPTSTTTTTPTPTATQTPMPTQSATATTVEATQTAKPTAMPTATATSVSSPVPSATSTSTPMTPLNQQQFMPLLLS